MNYQPIVPMIRTNELDETVAFYCDVLGFECGEKNDEWGWASLSKGGCEMMVATPNQHSPFEKPAFTGSFYIRVDDVDSLWQQVKSKAGIVYEIETFDWGMREFAIYDNNGYMLQFGQDISGEY